MLCHCTGGRGGTWHRLDRRMNSYPVPVVEGIAEYPSFNIVARSNAKLKEEEEKKRTQEQK